MRKKDKINLDPPKDQKYNFKVHVGITTNQYNLILKALEHLNNGGINNLTMGSFTRRALITYAQMCIHGQAVESLILPTTFDDKKEDIKD